MALQLFFTPARRTADQPLPRRRIGEPLRRIAAVHRSFWERHPALLSSISLLVGTSALLFCGHFLWVLAWSAYLLFCRAFPQILLVFGAIAYGHFHRPPPIPPNATGIFHPHSIQLHQTPFQRGYAYKGSLTLENGSIPCVIHYRGGDRPNADRDYFVRGKIDERNAGDFLCKAKHLEPGPHSRSLAELRFQTKERFRKFLSSRLSPRAASFLGSLITGDVEDRLFRYEFGRLGLQHILAISGFHFGILIAFCSFCLGLFLPRTGKIAGLFIAVNAYFFFVGPSPAVQRSWLTALFYLLGQFLNRPSPSLNILGCALAAELIWNPLVSANLGFQLSFLSCGGILLFHPLFNRLLQTPFPKRSWSDVQALNSISRHGYVLSSFTRNALSLTLSVNLVLLPLLLYHFHTFPLFSLLYNLFFPFLVGAALFLLLIALLFHSLAPPLAQLVFSLTDSFASLLLDLVSYPPLALDYSLQIQEFPSHAICAFLLVILFLSPSIQAVTKEFGIVPLDSANQVAAR